MKLAEAYVVWKPQTDQVEVIHESQKRSIPPRYYWLGIAQSDFGAKQPETAVERELLMFVTFNTLVVRDSVPAEAVHKAFLRVEEYRKRISRDTPGADD